MHGYPERPVDGNIRYALNRRVDQWHRQRCRTGRAGRFRQTRRHRHDQRIRRRLTAKRSCVVPRNWPGWHRKIPSSCRQSASRPTRPPRPLPEDGRDHAGIPRQGRRQIRSIRARRHKLIAAGFLSDSAGFSAIANSNGNFGYQTSTNVDYTCTVRTEDGTGSGWVARNLADVTQFDADEEIKIAIQQGTRLRRTPRRSSQASTR